MSTISRTTVQVLGLATVLQGNIHSLFLSTDDLIFNAAQEERPETWTDVQEALGLIFQKTSSLRDVVRAIDSPAIGSMRTWARECEERLDSLVGYLEAVRDVASMGLEGSKATRSVLNQGMWAFIHVQDAFQRDFKDLLSDALDA